MKKIYISILFAMISLNASSDIYQGCGTNEQDARLNLANNISTKIESTTFLKKENSSFFGLSNYYKTFTRSSKQTTNLALKEVTISNQNGQVCATIKKDTLLDLTKELIKKVSLYNISILPKYEKDKVIKINDILGDIKKSIVLYGVYQDKFPKNTLKILEDKLKLFTNLRAKYNSQFAKVTVVGDYSDLIIDNKKYKANQEIFLKAGKHKYKVDSKEYCKVEGEFTLENNIDFEKVVNLNKYNRPYLIINTNKKDALLTINNQEFPLGKKYIANKCDGSDISYSVKYENNVENGILKLEPNNVLKKEFTFYSNYEKKKFVKLSNSYENSSRLEIKYGYMIVNLNDDYKDYDNLHTIQINYIHTKNAFRYGFGAVYGENNSSSKAYELYYNIGLQLANISNDTALHIGSVVIIPSLTAQIGAGYHKLYKEDGQTYIDKFDDTDEITWDNNGIAKLNFGIDFLVNQNIGINIFAQKQYTMEKSVTFGTGLSLKF